MSSELALAMRDVSKAYRISHAPAQTTLREAILSTFRRPRPEKASVEEFWALRDVTFDVSRGEVVGIVGRNGAGKSTLLKILSRITPPTLGEAEMRGRIGSLLEVGTGFHPELTGRENIYLNGAILGMRRREIERQFDEIVSFAEVERFLDTPVKRYSSGMYIRLAFSVAAHLDPDILIVDEVLAVGDAAFQAKCLGRMQTVARESDRTVLFVSHNMAAINALCTRGILLDRGRVALDGTAAAVVAAYHTTIHSAMVTGADLTNAPRRGDGQVRFTRMTVIPESADGTPLDVGETGCSWRIGLSFMASRPVSHLMIDLSITDPNGVKLIDANLSKKSLSLSMAAGEHRDVVFVLHDVLLKPGKYLLGLWAGSTAQHFDHLDPAGVFEVLTYREDARLEAYPGPYACRFDVEVGAAEVVR
jgi:lipopolysaccharide transport system ATP-binding protein